MATKKETKKTKKTVSNGEGILTIQLSSNNTIATISDSLGNALRQCSAGALGYRGAKKSTPFVAQQIIETVLKDVTTTFGISKIAIYVKGSAGGRDAAIRAAASSGLGVTLIKDVSPIPHNGCRPPKARRL